MNSSAQQLMNNCAFDSYLFRSHSVLFGTPIQHTQKKKYFFLYDGVTAVTVTSVQCMHCALCSESVKPKTDNDC